MSRQRVAVTGIGVMSPLGCGSRAFREGLAAGRSGIGPITLFDVSTFPVRIGGQVPWAPPADGGPAPRDRKVGLGLAAAAEALGDAGLDAAALEDAVLHVGVSLEVFAIEDFEAGPDLEAALAEWLARRDGRELRTPLDRLAETLGGRHGFLGGRHTNASACAAGAQAIGEAFLQVREGRARSALAGAADSMLHPLGLGGFGLLGVLSAENDRPGSACRPFDRTRTGTVLGEGAAFLVLEDLDAALERGAPIRAEVLGYGSSLDAYRVSDPDPDGRGACRSMRSALADADLGPGDVDCVNAHGTGTPKNDVVEAAALREVLGDRAQRIPVHAVKSLTGHCIAASGAVEAAAAVITLESGLVPPTAGLAEPDPACGLGCLPRQALPFDGRTVLSNSFGFGGQNAALVFGKWEGP